MKQNALINFIRLVFGLLYWGTYIVIGGSLLTFMWIYIGSHWRDRSYLPTSHPRVFLDTTDRVSTTDFMEVTESDAQGRVLERQVQEGGDMVTYDGRGKQIERRSMASLRRRADSLERTLPTSVKKERAAELRQLSQFQQKKIDSILQADPNAIVVKRGNGFSSSGFGYGTIAIQLPGQFWHKGRSISSNTVSDVPVQRSLSVIRTAAAEQQLQFRYGTAHAFFHLPPIVWVGFLINLVLLVGGPLRIFWLFRNLFTEFSARQYFTNKQVGRMGQIGRTLVWLFVSLHAVRQAQYYWAIRYMTDHDYLVYPPDSNSFLWPTNWLLLLSGLTLLALAQVFLHGLQLQRDSELTI